MKLYRSKKHRVISGVLGGIAERFNWNVNLLRLLWVLLTFVPFPSVILYVFLWMVLPESED